MIYKGRIAILYFVIRDGLFTDSYTVHLKDLNIPSTICDRPDLSAGARPDDLGLEVTGQRIEPDPAVLVCHIAGEDRWCRRCACQGASCGTAVGRLAHVPCGWRPTSGRPPSPTRGASAWRSPRWIDLPGSQAQPLKNSPARGRSSISSTSRTWPVVLSMSAAGTSGKNVTSDAGVATALTEIVSLGRTLKRRSRDILAYFDQPPHHRRSHRSHQRPPRTPTRLRTRTCETSPTTPPEHSSKQEDSKPNYTPNYEEPLFPVDLDAPYRQSQRPREPPRSPNARLRHRDNDRGG